MPKGSSKAFSSREQSEQSRNNRGQTTYNYAVMCVGRAKNKTWFVPYFPLDPAHTAVTLYTMQRAAAVLGKRLRLDLVDAPGADLPEGVETNC